jgi:hypothetical protein
MSFLKRIFGGSKWETLADEDERPATFAPAPRYAPRPAAPAPRAPAAASPAAGAPLPRFQPGARPGTEVGTGPVVRVSPAQLAAPVPSKRPPPLASPAAPVPAPGSEVLGRIALTRPPPRRHAVREVQAPRESVLDQVGDGDLSFPEELRGCAVVERTAPDGRTDVVYRGPDGFTVAEADAQVLIDAYRAEHVAPKVPRPPTAGRYAAPIPAPAPARVEPKLLQVLGSPVTGEEVIEVLGRGEDVPPELRGARFVRSGGQFRYLLEGGKRYSTIQAEEVMDRWERRQAAARVASAALAAHPPTPAPAPSPAPPARPVAAASRPTPGPLPAVRPFAPGLPPVTVPDASPGALLPREPTPAAPTPAALALGDTTAVDAPAAPLDEGDTAPVSAPGPEAAPAELTPARLAAEALRQRVLADPAVVTLADVTPQRLQLAVEQEIGRRRTLHRLELLIELSLQARQVLIDAWQRSSARECRDAAKELESDLLVAGLANPLTLRSIDQAELLSLVLLRSSARRRTSVITEVARAVAEQVPGHLTQFLMTRSFVDRVARHHTADTPERAMSLVLTERLHEAVSEALENVFRRHGVWLPELGARLSQVLEPVVLSLVRKR